MPKYTIIPRILQRMTQEPVADHLTETTEYKGICIPDELIRLVNICKDQGTVEANVDVRALPEEERLSWVKEVTDTLVSGSDVQFSPDVVNSVNPLGGPPWITPDLGGSRPVRFFSQGEWKEEQRFHFGPHQAAAVYFVEFEFHTAD